jgi:hypothetical protein
MILFGQLNWFMWLVAGVGIVWGACFLLILPVFLLLDTCNNRNYGKTGLLGLAHTLVRVPRLALLAPFSLAIAIKHALLLKRKRISSSH